MSFPVQKNDTNKNQSSSKTKSTCLAPTVLAYNGNHSYRWKNMLGISAVADPKLKIREFKIVF